MRMRVGARARARARVKGEGEGWPTSGMPSAKAKYVFLLPRTSEAIAQPARPPELARPREETYCAVKAGVTTAGIAVAKISVMIVFALEMSSMPG